MSLDLKPVQVRLGQEAYEILDLLADADDKDLGEVAREILTEALLGKGHAIKILAHRLSRAVTSGRSR
jgi:hypothetical protein